MLHGAWILIILGAFVTRYFGFEGVMPIREGETTNTFLSEKTYVTVLVDGEMDGALQRKKLQDDFLFAEPRTITFVGEVPLMNRSFQLNMLILFPMLLKV